MTLPQTRSADAGDCAVMDARAFLSKHHCLGLATNGPEGIWACTVFYVSQGFELYFLSSDKTRHAKNVEAAPHVAGTIHDDVSDWLSIRGVQLEGIAERVGDARRREVLELFALRYPFPETLWWSEAGVVPRAEQCIYVVRPKRLFYLNHRLRDGRFEVPSELLRADVVG